LIGNKEIRTGLKDMKWKEVGTKVENESLKRQKILNVDDKCKMGYTKAQQKLSPVTT
jgi:hypothetical protein